jgi:hypothetical protein
MTDPKLEQAIAVLERIHPGRRKYARIVLDALAEAHVEIAVLKENWLAEEKRCAAAEAKLAEAQAAHDTEFRQRRIFEEKLKEAEAREAKLREALEQIGEGAGPFSRDPLEHAANCIKAMKRIARDALVASPEPVRTPSIRTRILTMMECRGWSTHWVHRSAYLHLEAAELAEAVRGKRGDALDESADVLMTMLALSPFDLDVIVAAAEAKVSHLMDAPPYKGEEHAASPEPAPPEEKP